MTLLDRLAWGLLPAVPVPFRGEMLDAGAQHRYARWMAGMPGAGVAVWAHTGRGPYLTPAQRALVIRSWREAMPERVIVAGARDEAMAAEAQQGGADALLAFPASDDPVGHHRRLGRHLPVIAFLLYDAAGGVAYDDATLHAILELPAVVGIKVATLDSVLTFQRVAAVCRHHPDKLLITGEDRFLGYSLLCGARGALLGMGAALPDLQADLLRACADEDWPRFIALSDRCDRFSQVTFIAPMEGYIRRMLWAAAAEGAIPKAACDDPWGPPLPDPERAAVEAQVRIARAARG
ncbi:MAG: dihydrodipicolinate synthase family protein [Gemmatimonadales bacterium]|nr:dihydrodipicolinate synthase family protein [Gemmatimonadales bacterium]